VRWVRWCDDFGSQVLGVEDVRRLNCMTVTRAIGSLARQEKIAAPKATSGGQSSRALRLYLLPDP
jgi:hypothetical protein